MSSEIAAYIAQGRDKGKSGHGIAHWTKSLAFFARTELHISGLRQEFSPRPTLGHDIALGLIMIARETPMTEATFSALVGDACHIFHFLDYIEEASRSGATEKPINFDGGIEHVPGMVWALFMTWLEARFKKNVLSRAYSQSARVCKAAARRKFGEIPPHFLLAPNPYPQIRGADSGNWDRDDDIDDDEYKAIGAALIERLKLASQRIAGARSLLPIEAQSPPQDGIPQWSNEPPTTTSTDGVNALAFRQIWNHLEQTGRIAQTAIVGIDEPAFFDVYPNHISDDALASRIVLKNDLSAYNIDMRRTILREVSEREVYCSHAEAAALKLSYFNLQTQARQLAALGWLDCIEINQRKRFFIANHKTALAIPMYDQVSALLNAPKLVMGDQRKILHCALATRDELANALGFFLLRSGWNLSTALDLKATSWHQPHPIQGVKGTYVELFSLKGRAGGNRQWAQSSSNKPFTSYDIIRRVLTWTEPLRIMIRRQIAHLEAALRSQSSTMSSSEKLAIRGQLSVLHGLKDRTWLTIFDDGRIGDLASQWADLDNALAAEGVTRSDGSRVKFSQSMTRRAFASFAYEKSGTNFVLTKLALGHTDFASLLTYIASRKRRSAQREEWVKLQTALVDRFRRGKSTAPEIIRALVKDGKLTDEEADSLVEEKFRTKKGTLCAAPRSPDPGIDPGHKEGQLCGTQDCLSGCSKSFVTFETAVFIAGEIARMETLRGMMDVISWRSSSDCEDLASLERIFDRYAPDTQKAAKVAASKQHVRPIFGAPSNLAVRRARNVPAC